jgi:hypothetical protein
MFWELKLNSQNVLYLETEGVGYIVANGMDGFCKKFLLGKTKLQN